MSRTQTLPPGSSQTHRLGGRGEGQAHLRANVPAYAGAARAQRTSSLLARADGQQSLPGGSESDYCVWGGGAGSSTHLSPSPCPSVRGGGFLAAYGRVCLPLVLARWELALLGEQEERV